MNISYFNCGRVSENVDNGQTIREFTLIVDENKHLPISGQGHILNGWTYNGTVPGPTMRMTERDLVRIKVINSEIMQKLILSYGFYSFSRYGWC